MKHLQHWIFDLDGTLTVAQHDFDAIRVELGVPPGMLILEYIDQCAEEKAASLTRRLRAIEHQLATESQPADGAIEFLETLCDSNVTLGILTRNTRSNALTSLSSTGLARYFEHGNIIGREEATPKPAPDGIFHLMSQWQAESSNTVMVGDFRFDLEAGRAAEVHTVHIAATSAEHWPDVTDHRFSSLASLAEVYRSS